MFPEDFEFSGKTIMINSQQAKNSG